MTFFQYMANSLAPPLALLVLYISPSLVAIDAPDPLLEVAYYALIPRLTVQPPLLSLLFYFCAADGVATQPTELAVAPSPTIARPVSPRLYCTPFTSVLYLAMFLFFFRCVFHTLEGRVFPLCSSL